MISLSDFFDINQEIILFIYGLVFFIMGFAIILQTRHASRLELARSLRWLAAFGVMHGFYKWGDFFIPTQVQYLSAPAIVLLQSIQLFLLAASFACLFEFGVVALHPLGRARWLHGIAAGLMVIWTLVVFFVLPPTQPDTDHWYATANALARYFICFPGGLLAAYGLRKHTRLRIAPLNAPEIVRTLNVVVMTLIAFAFLGGLIPLPVDFFPGNILNNQTFMDFFFGIPVTVFRTTVGLVIAIAIIHALEIFDLETQRLIERLEQEQIIEADHEHLARELHDGAIQKVYTAGLLVESAVRLVKPDSEIGLRLGRAVMVLNDAIADLRQNLVDLHSQTSHLAEPFPQMLRHLVQDPHYNYSALVDISLDIKLLEESQLSSVRANHIFAIINEAMSNVARHARARSVKISVQDLDNKYLEIIIKDDGIGIASNARSGYGLRNMRDRARLLNGQLDFSPANGKGTSITLKVPWVD